MKLNNMHLRVCYRSMCAARSLLFTCLLGIGMGVGVAAERIDITGESPCPNHNANNTTWTQSGGCTCDAGWTGSTCNIPANQTPGTISAASILPSRGREGIRGRIGPHIDNPFIGSKFAEYHNPHFQRGMYALVFKCNDAGGKDATFTYMGKQHVYCYFPEEGGKARDCFYQGSGLWYCGMADPTMGRLARRAGL